MFQGLKSYRDRGQVCPIYSVSQASNTVPGTEQVSTKTCQINEEMKPLKTIETESSKCDVKPVKRTTVKLTLDKQSSENPVKIA